MTCVDADVKRRCSNTVVDARVPGVHFDAVAYADDTILYSTDPNVLNELLYSFVSHRRLFPTFWVKSQQGEMPFYPHVP